MRGEENSREGGDWGINSPRNQLKAAGIEEGTMHLMVNSCEKLSCGLVLHGHAAKRFQ